jgi:hypothetical protein
LIFTFISFHQPTEKFADKRTKIVRELLETERTYVKGLTELVKLFEEPSAQKHLLPPEDHKIIFSTIGTILNCNTKVLELLEQRFLRWQPASTVIGDVFLQFSDFLKASTTHYASLYNESINKLVEYTQKKSDFGSYCKVWMQMLSYPFLPFSSFFHTLASSSSFSLSFPLLRSFLQDSLTFHLYHTGYIRERQNHVS